MKNNCKFLMICLISSILTGVFGCKRAPVSQNQDVKNEDFVGLANPVKESSKEDILTTTGLTFNVPEDAKNVRYSIISGSLAQADFLWNDAECTVRAKLSSELELKDISGFYYDWQKSSVVKVGYNNATLKLYNSEEGTLGICIWWDAVPGIMYSVSMKQNATEKSLENLANLVYVQMQGNS